MVAVRLLVEMLGLLAVSAPGAPMVAAAAAAVVRRTALEGPRRIPVVALPRRRLPAGSAPRARRPQVPRPVALVVLKLVPQPRLK
eukprot:710468-Alexandrium_andersonii.AAC.1